MEDRCVLHVDMNNFFASVECKMNPSIKDFPVAVCGCQGDRHGIVLAKNYHAKAYGVTTGEAVWEAKQKCPSLVIVPPHYEEYMKYSEAARRIYSDYTDKVEPFGMDECWLDITGGKYIKADGEKTANEIRERIKKELGVTVSVGVSFNKIFAKLGSDMKKPDAVTVITKESFRDQIWDLPVGDMMGVGYATQKKLASYCIFTIGKLAEWPLDFFEKKLGKMGRLIWMFANGLDESPVIPRDPEMLDKTCGHGTTAIADLENPDEVWRFLLELSQDIGHRLRVYNKKANGVSVSVRDNELITRQYQCKIPMPTQSAKVIAEQAFDLFRRNYRWNRNIRSITVRAINLISNDDDCQLNIFSNAENVVRAEAIDSTVDKLRTRYGKHIVVNACLLDNPKMSKNDHHVIMPMGIPV